MRGKITITVLVDKNQHTELTLAAQKAGMTLAAFMRSAGLAKARRDKEIG